jgi:hypothetical protein
MLDVNMLLTIAAYTSPQPSPWGEGMARLDSEFLSWRRSETLGEF